MKWFGLCLRQGRKHNPNQQFQRSLAGRKRNPAETNTLCYNGRAARPKRTEHMQTIKKYANRKLYHTNKKQYITLDGIAQLVQDGNVVQILDNETGDDITSSILTQVVLHVRARGNAPLPTNFLTGLIRIGGDTLASLRHTLFASLGGSELIEAEIGRRINYLVQNNELAPEEGVRWQQMLLRKEFAQSADDQLADREAEMPRRSDVFRLHRQVDALAERIEQLLNERSGSAEDTRQTGK
jgi:polyhydroxyalkanoate synthesis repressor PhaR